MRARRLVAALVEFLVAIIMSFLFAQVAARLIESPDPLAYTIGTVGAYTLGIMVGVYFSAEILDINGNFWFLFVGALFSGIVIFAAYDFRATTSLGFQEAIIEFVTSITILGPALGTLAFNIGPKSYGNK
ncbi:MAG TPA: hypothetical protein VFI27_06175 [candidate division Zixibacteria bacterium]|nr:hypothetical protein [candidate division Zixibacteria bacterium]